MKTQIKDKINPYNEVYGILNYLDPEFYNRIPKDLLKRIESQMSYEFINNQKKYYIPNYNLNENFDFSTISKEAVAMICIIYHNYFCDSQEEKQSIKNIILTNEKNTEKLKNDKYGNFTFNSRNNYTNLNDITTSNNNKILNNNIIPNKSKISNTKTLTKNNTNLMQPEINQEENTYLKKIEKKSWIQNIFEKIRKLFNKK